MPKYNENNTQKLDDDDEKKDVKYNAQSYKLPSQVIQENFDGDDMKCSKWIYIVTGIFILLLVLLLVYLIIQKDKNALGSKSIKRSSSKQRFGFRFY
jgi:hypothetical protein